MSPVSDEEHGDALGLSPLPSSPVHVGTDDVVCFTDPRTGRACASVLCAAEECASALDSDKNAAKPCATQWPTNGDKAQVATAEATKRDRHVGNDDGCVAAGSEGNDEPVTKKSRGVVLSDKTDGNMLLRMGNCEGKGRAVFSKRAIKKGARIILDGVLWWIKSESAEHLKCDYEHEYKLFTEKYCTPEAIADGRATKVMRDLRMLQDSITQRRQTSADKFRHIFEINGWTHKKGTVVAVTFGSLVNHSCVPDFKVDFDLPQNHMVLTAKKNVANGREVSVSYLSQAMLDSSVDERQEALFSWGFCCKCPKCRTETAQHKKNAAAAGQSSTKRQSAKIVQRLAMIELNHTRRCQENQEHEDSDGELVDSDADGYSDEDTPGMSSSMSSAVKRGRRVKNAKMQGRIDRDGRESGSSSEDSDAEIAAAQQRAASTTPPLPVSCRITHKFAPFLPGMPRVAGRSGAQCITPLLPVPCRITHRFAPFLSTMPGAQDMLARAFTPHTHNSPALQMPTSHPPKISRLRQRMPPWVPKPHFPSAALEYALLSRNMPPFLQPDAVVRWEAEQQQKNKHDTLMERTRQDIDAQFAEHARHAIYTLSHLNANGGGF